MGLLLVMSVIETTTLLNINRVAPRVNAYFAVLLPFSVAALHFLGIIDIPSVWRLLFLALAAGHVLALAVLTRSKASAPVSVVPIPWVHASLYTGFGFIAPLLLFHADERYQAWITCLFVLVWTHDTFAYVFGKFFGKTPLSPSLSPRKTIEGSAGGLAMTLIAALFVIPLVWKSHPGIPHLTAMAVFTVLFGTFGDLYESLLKRRAGVKDSGYLIPGHGGILDRVDSFLFIMPVAALYLHLVFYYGVKFPIP
jgi:phosphatidate cytidylyltransferase